MIKKIFLIWLALCVNIASASNVLIIASNNSQMGDSTKPTGVWLTEITRTYQLLENAGVNVTIASLDGGYIPIDTNSIEIPDIDNDRFLNTIEMKQKIDQSISLASIFHRSYDAIILVGGYGSLWDYPNHKGLAEFIQRHYSAGKIIAAISQGVVGLSNVDVGNQKYLIEGKKLTAASDAIDAANYMKDAVPYSLEKRLIAGGAKFTSGPVNHSFVAVDNRVITAQNHQSVPSMVNEILKQLR